MLKTISMLGGHCPPNKTVSVIARSEATKQSHCHGGEIASDKTLLNAGYRSTTLKG
uniref:hypothetical protein n=1 Tax=Candidatus Loosdrechtia sp. TaxID=3101272 RepID=UPI00403AF05C